MHLMHIQHSVPLRFILEENSHDRIEVQALRIDTSRVYLRTRILSYADLALQYPGIRSYSIHIYKEEL
jgi:hypothetical protein